MEQPVEVNVGSTPEETKQNILADNSSLMSETDAVGVAAAMFGTYLPRFKARIRQLKGKAKERVINALIEVPLNMQDFKPQSAEERETFLVGQSLLEAKMIMILHSLQENEAKKMTEDKTEVTETTNGDNENV